MPSFMVMTVVYIYVALISYNVEVLTPDLDRLQTVVDNFAIVSRDEKFLWKSSDGVWDIPIERVNYILYGDRPVVKRSTTVRTPQLIKVPEIDIHEYVNEKEENDTENSLDDVKTVMSN